MTDTSIKEYLEANGGRLINSHFVFTSGMHSTEYFNIRAVVQDARWVNAIGSRLAMSLSIYGPDIIVGPETLGRTFAHPTAFGLGVSAIWCEIDGGGSDKAASFSAKMDFGRLVPGKRVAIVDDLLTSGGSIKVVSDLITSLGGEVVAAAAIVRRNSAVRAEDCGVPSLEVLEDIEGAAPLTPEECAEFGPCSEQVPMVLRPGHGWKWHELPENRDYPVAS